MMGLGALNCLMTFSLLLLWTIAWHAATASIRGGSSGVVGEKKGVAQSPSLNTKKRSEAMDRNIKKARVNFKDNPNDIMLDKSKRTKTTARLITKSSRKYSSNASRPARLAAGDERDFEGGLAELDPATKLNSNGTSTADDDVDLRLDRDAYYKKKREDRDKKKRKEDSIKRSLADKGSSRSILSDFSAKYSNALLSTPSLQQAFSVGN